jgi:hypothetical protein
MKPTEWVQNVTIELENVDWIMLREQKLQLLLQLSFLERTQQIKKAEGLQGLLNFIDYLQDQAVTAGVPKEHVYLHEDEEEE